MPPLLAEDLDFVLNALASTWPGLRGWRIFITGGTGFFGSWLIETLVEANRRYGLELKLFVLSRNPSAFLERVPHLRAASEIEWIQGSIWELKSDSIGVTKGGATRLDALVHLVTEANHEAMARDPLAGVDLIAEGTRRALEFAVAAGVRRFLFTSSGAVYGRQPANLERIPEDYAGAPDVMDLSSPYAAAGNAKRQAELYCALYSKKKSVEAVVARCFSFVGPHLPLDGKFAAGNFLSAALAGRNLVIRGDGTPIRSYLYAADLCWWLLRLLVAGAPGRAYNVGSAQAVSIRELAERTIRVSGRPLQLEVRTLADPKQPADRYVPDVGRIQRELGLRETIMLDEGLERTWRWLRSGNG